MSFVGKGTKKFHFSIIIYQLYFVPLQPNFKYQP